MSCNARFGEKKTTSVAEAWDRPADLGHLVERWHVAGVTADRVGGANSWFDSSTSDVSPSSPTDDFGLQGVVAAPGGVLYAVAVLVWAPRIRADRSRWP